MPATTKISNAKKLRNLLASERCPMIPGGYDAFTMALAETTGYKAGYLGGYSMAASLTRTPDWGLITMTEMIHQVTNAVNAVNIPLITDIDQGFGALTNFVRTIHAYEHSGAAAVHFEDQPFPKKCSLMPGRTVISVDENVKKIKAAVETREDPDFVLIARTDAQLSEGLDGILRRMDAYLNAGADFTIYCEQESEKDVETVGSKFPGRVIIFAGDAPGVKAFYLPAAIYREMGYAAIIYCAAAFSAAHKAVKNLFVEMQQQGGLSIECHQEHCCTVHENNAVSQIKDWQALRDKYSMV
jgi:2-methylisocitrate lyase-like PEP mutase family enzyme